MTLSSRLSFHGSENLGPQTVAFISTTTDDSDSNGSALLLPWLEGQMGRHPSQGTGNPISYQAFFAQLTVQDRSELQQRFGANGLAGLQALADETNLDLFYSDLFSLGQELEQQGLHAGAAQIYQFFDQAGEGSESDSTSRLASSPVLAQIAPRASERLAVMQGAGTPGDSLEWYGQQIVEGITDGPSLLAFGVAGASFRLGRVATARMLMSHGPRSLAQSGLGLRLASGLGGFMVEGSVFPLTHLAAEQAIGRPVDWSVAHLQTAILSSYLVLGGLRAGGVIGRSGHLWAGKNRGLLQALSGSAAFTRSAPAMIPLGAQFGGVLLGQWGQERFGLAESRNLSAHLVSGLVTLIQMQGMGAVHHGLTGQTLGRWERNLDQQTETLLQSRGRRPFKTPGLRWGDGLALATAAVGEGGPEATSADPLLANHVFNMGSENGGGRGRDPSKVVPGVRWSSEDPRQAESRVSQPEFSDPLRDEAAAAFLLENDPGRFEQGLRNFINSQDLPIAVAWVKLTKGLGEIFMVNERFTEKFGFDSEAMQNFPLRDLFHSQDAIRVVPMIPLRMGSGYFPPMPMRLRHQSGDWVQVVGSGVYRKVFGRNLAFGYFRDVPADNEANMEPAPMLEMLRESRNKVKPNRQGVVDLKSLVEMNLQMAMPNAGIISRLRSNNLRLRITGHTSKGILERQMGPWVRFLNMMDRREAFPVGRRLEIEVPEGEGRIGEKLVLIRGAEEFHPLGEEAKTPPPKVSDASSTGSGSSRFPASSQGNSGLTGTSLPAGFKPRPSGTLARVSAALEGRELPPAREGSQEEFFSQLGKMKSGLQKLVQDQGYWGGDQMRLELNAELAPADLIKHQAHVLSYFNHLTGTKVIPLGLPVTLVFRTPSGDQSFQLIRHMEGFKFSDE